MDASQVVSLQDPLSRLRIQKPARGAACRHVSCFDLLTYLQFNRKNRKWKCPIWYSMCFVWTCSAVQFAYAGYSFKPATLENLVYDQFMGRILKELPECTEVLVRRRDVCPGGVICCDTVAASGGVRC